MQEIIATGIPPPGRSGAGHSPKFSEQNQKFQRLYNHPVGLFIAKDRIPVWQILVSQYSGYVVRVGFRRVQVFSGIHGGKCSEKT